MTIYPLDMAVIIWGLIGDYVLKQLLQLQARRECSQSAVIAAAMVFIVIPLIALRAEIAEYSALGIVAVGLAVFWFAILASRSWRIT